MISGAQILEWTKKLAPCPFCGTKEPHLFIPKLPMMADCDDIFVRCHSCDAVGPSIMYDQAVHTPDDIPDLVEEVTGLWNNRPKIVDE